MEKENNNSNTDTKINSNLENKIEALLFYRGNPVKIKELQKVLSCSEEEIINSLDKLRNNLSNRGIRLTEKEDTVVLVTSPEASQLITELKKEELTKDLSKSALETLSIIMYRGPVKRSDIDYVRGVNSQFILRLLLVRDLIEKITNPQDERGYLYKVSVNLLNLLGINNMKEIPDYQKVNDQIDDFLNSVDQDEE